MNVIKFFSLMAMITFVTAAAKPPADKDAEFQAILSESYKADAPGASVLIKKDGKILWRSALGMADLENNLSIDPSMVFRIGSITKQFTAVAILRLAEAGKIDIQAPIRTYLPDYPEAAADVTVEHLLTHTSGIVSYTGMQEWVPMIREDKTTEEMVDIFKDKPLEFEPGSQYRYNNSGYFLLGVIIEKVTGETYAEHIEKTIFKPLGMNASYYGNVTQLIPNRARGYEGSAANGWRNASYLSMSQPYAAGSLLSTVDDLAKWDAALYDDTLLPKATRKAMFTKYKLSDGEEVSYGYGWQIDTIRGRQAIHHGGGINGFVTEILRIPEEKLLVVVLTNRGGGQVRPYPAAAKLAAAAMNDPYPARKEYTVSKETLNEYPGVYSIDGTEDERYFSLEGNALLSQRKGGSKQEIFPFDKDSFYFPNSLTYVVFQRNDQGAIRGAVVYQGGEEAEPATRTDKELPRFPDVVALPPDVLAKYAGVYDMEIQGNPKMTIRADGDQIFAQLTGQPEFEIFASAENEFFLKVVEARVVFSRNDKGEVEYLTLYQGNFEIKGTRQ